ncbi:MAG: ribbon-helix-helix domain-containing protein [Cyanobacteria bacterium]|nr:ribbon-helix-helix domain-containing protein [Cyanobacteriota bacterium]
MRLPQRLELEIDPDLYERIEELSIRSGRSVPEIIQALISCSFPMDPAETVFRETVS